MAALPGANRLFPDSPAEAREGRRGTRVVTDVGRILVLQAQQELAAIEMIARYGLAPLGYERVSDAVAILRQALDVCRHTAGFTTAAEEDHHRAVQAWWDAIEPATREMAA